MKLFYSAGSCSTSCHIGLEESGLPHEAIEVDWDENKNVAELESLNPLGVVPVLVSNEGRTLTQNEAILQHVADLSPKSGLLAPAGTWERAETLAWLSFVAADLHKAYSPLFGLDRVYKNDTTKAEVRAYVTDNVQKHLAHVNAHLGGGRDFLMGRQFTVADCYLFVVASWSKWLGVDMSAHSNLNAYLARVAARPAVQRVLKAEGLAD